MPRYQMEVVADPGSKGATLKRANVIFANKHPYCHIVGNGDQNYLCGACKAVLIHNLNPREVKIQGIHFHCASCGNFNLVRGT